MQALCIDGKYRVVHSLYLEDFLLSSIHDIGENVAPMRIVLYAVE